MDNEKHATWRVCLEPVDGNEELLGYTPEQICAITEQHYRKAAKKGFKMARREIAVRVPKKIAIALK